MICVVVVVLFKLKIILAGPAGLWERASELMTISLSLSAKG
jgi:hypothetical protein